MKRADSEVIDWLNRLSPSNQSPYEAREKGDYLVYRQGSYELKVLNSREAVKGILGNRWRSPQKGRYEAEMYPSTKKRKFDKVYIVGDWWTDRSIAVRGAPPQGVAVEDATAKLHQPLRQLLSCKYQPAKLVEFLYDGSMEIRSNDPIPYPKGEKEPVVKFKSRSMEIEVNQLYYNVVTDYFERDELKYGICNSRTLVVFHNNEVVALIVGEQK